MLSLVKDNKGEFLTKSRVQRGVLKMICTLCSAFKLPSASKTAHKLADSLLCSESCPTAQILHKKPQKLCSHSDKVLSIDENKFELRIALIAFIANCEIDIDRWAVIVRMSAKKMKEVLVSLIAELCSEHKIAPKIDLSTLLLSLEHKSISNPATSGPSVEAVHYSRDFVAAFTSTSDKRSTNQTAPFVGLLLSALRLTAQDDSMYSKFVASLAKRFIPEIEDSSKILSSEIKGQSKKKKIEDTIDLMIKQKVPFKSIIDFFSRNIPDSAAVSILNIKRHLKANCIHGLATLDTTCIFKAWPVLDGSTLKHIAIRSKV